MFTLDRSMWCQWIVVFAATILVPSCAAQTVDGASGSFQVFAAGCYVVPDGYFDECHQALRKEWPNNRRFHVVFHGHSVPAGYFKTPTVQTFDAYPHLFHAKLAKRFPTATIDVSVTAIGGENSRSGAERLDDDVLALNPDVVCIDYGLNDRRLGLEETEKAWRSMIERLVANNIHVVLLTPTPDTHEDILSADAPLAKYAELIRRLATEYKLPLVDCYIQFQQLAKNGAKLADLMSIPNHPNRAGHEVVANLLFNAFEVGKKLPDRVDLSEKIKTMGLEQRRQGARGTCSVFASMEAVEFAIATASGHSDPLSIEYANWAANHATGRSDDGDFFMNILKGIEVYGFCSETDMPYQAEYSGPQPTVELQAEASDGIRKFDLSVYWLSEWKQTPGLTLQEVNRIKQALACGYPVAAGSYHSVLFVGYENDESLPGGGKFLISDSNLVETEIHFSDAMQRFSDCFWVKAETQK
ncbi:MAG: GDSL-type esterase/lipase family protein [Pirellulaceae bacterium]